MSIIIEAFSRIFNDVYAMRCLLLGAQAASFFCKIVLLFSFTKHLFSKNNKYPVSWKFLLIVLSCSTFEDFSWIVSLSRYTFLPMLDYRPVVFIIRITWAFNILMYQTFALFLESFTERMNKISYHQMVSCLISSFFFLYPLSLAFFQFNKINNRPQLEFMTYSLESIYALCILMPLTLFYVWRNLQRTRSHKILTTQLKTVIKYLIFPHLIINLYHTFPMPMHGISDGGTILATACSNIFLTVALFYCLKKVIRLRFLNVHNHVHSGGNFTFSDNFKSILESLGSATTAGEVQLLTQRFFIESFHIPASSTSLVIRASKASFQTEQHENSSLEKLSIIEQFLSGQTTESFNLLAQYLKSSKILIYDEVEYDNFYENDPTQKIILEFLQKSQVDIFLPIYEHNTIIGYITVDRHARGEQLYSNIERDEMIVFASFLSKIINLLQNRNLNELLKQRKDIIEELYLKHQEINQYKESIRSFLTQNQRSIGIIFYKNGKFSSANQDARELIEIDPNQHLGHPITKALKHISQQAFVYQTNQTQSARTSNGRRIMLSAIPQIEYNTVIIAVYYPEMYDTIKEQIDAMHDPSDWDYLLYLETTRSGKLINQLIPGSGEILLNFKINLLKLSLGKKALLLDLPEDDLIPSVDLIHHISLRETLYTLELQSQVSNADTAIRLFGINPLYGTNTETPLLEKLNKNGTLLIKNIHLLDIESQNNLAQFIRYGFYTIFKSDKRVQSDVRIICSTNRDLRTLVQEGKFSQSLFNELKKESLSMPSLLTLSHKEMEQLVEGFTDQALTTNEFKNLISLSHRDKDYIAAQRPISLNELKNRVQQLLINKSKKTGMYHETQFDPAYHVTDPKLIEAARLGKHALKDPKLLRVLWDKFKSQNKIALFLGVNRSSVNRRCKEYNII